MAQNNNGRRKQVTNNNKLQRRNKPKARRRRNQHKAPTIITFIFLSIYLLGYLIVFIGKPSIGVETVGYGTIDVPQVLKGIIVRDEYVEKSTMGGQPVYNFSENERVKKGALICSIKNVETTEVLESKIEEIDKDILNKQKARSDISIFQEDITEIEKKISNAVDSYTYKFIDGNMTDVYSLRSQIETQINRRNEIWLLENTQSMSELSDEKNRYQAELAENVAAISTQSSGILDFSIDGFEEILTPESLDSITKEQIEMQIKPEPISKNKVIAIEDPVFKIVKSNVWYITAYIPNEMTSTWEEGDTKTIKATVQEEEESVEVTIDKMTAGENDTYVIFKTDKNVVDFMEQRNIDFTIEGDIYKGIKIPNNAIVEKSLLKIPAASIIDSVDQNGVIKMVNGQGVFTNIKISKQDTDDNDGTTVEYAYILQDFDTLRLGDIIMNGTGETAPQFTISEVFTYKGVFVVNSSIAKFKIIDIMGQNNDYAIVKPSEGNYGLKVYDNIVSDAKNVEESDAIY